MPYAYKKSERLRKNSEFLSAMKGKRLSLDGLSLFYARNTVGHFRVGISVGKKIGNAVQRNKLRRRLRDCIMRLLQNRENGFDVVFVARQGLSEADFEMIFRVVEKILTKAGLGGANHEGVLS